MRGLRALRWGALWGAALGFSILAPFLLRSHHLSPGSASQWIVIELALLAQFAALGALLSFFNGFILVAWETLRHRPLRNPSLAYGLALGPLLGPAYFADSAVIEWLNFGRISWPEADGLLLGGAVDIATAAIFVWIYAKLAARPKRTSALPLGISLFAVALLAAVSLPDRISAESKGVEADAPDLIPLERGQTTLPPLLFVGIDSGNWRTLRPLLDRGSLPTLRSVISTGLTGEVRAEPPPFWSGPAWAAIVTGTPRHVNGIHEDLMAMAPGLPAFEVPLTLDFRLDPILAFEYGLLRAGWIRLVPHPRSYLRQPPFWELLSRAGVKTAVVRFPFTFPAQGQAEFVISNWVGSDEWRLLGVHTDSDSGLASPSAIESELRVPFTGESPEDEVLLAELLPEPWPKERTDLAVDPIEVLRLAASIDRRTLEASERLIRSHPEIHVLAVYLGGFDSVCHAFWQYRFPEDFPGSPPPAERVLAFGGVIDRYLEFLDRGLARLIEAQATPPNVIVIADHGHEAIHTHMLWKGWHAGRGGIFLAAGPGIPHRAEKLEVDYLDVVPTILELEGFARPERLSGRSLLH